MQLDAKGKDVTPKPTRTTIFILLVCVIFVASSDATLMIHVQDRAGKPLSPVRVQVFAGTLEPDSDIKPMPPSQPRADGFVGFVTDKRGRVVVNLPPGRHTIVASPDLDSGQIDESFLLVREVNAPGEVRLSLAEAIPVTVQAIGENDLGTLAAARVSFRPSQHTLGYVGLVKNDGQLQTAVSPGRYHVVITGSIALHYVILRDQVISPARTTLTFNGNTQPTAQLQLDLPAHTSLALYEVLGTNISSETINIIENTIGYDAAYTASFALALDTNAPSMQLMTGLTYQLNLSYVVDIDRKGTLYAYELRINELQVNTPRAYHIGNDGAHAFTLTAETEASEYRPGDLVVVRYKISDTQDNQLFRFFNFSAARLVFPFVVVRDPDGVVVGSNPVTSELPEDFFRFAFQLPKTAQLGEYRVSVSLDAKVYGHLSDHFTFQVTPVTDSETPKISDISAPRTAEANAPLQISAKIEDESSLSKVSLTFSDGTDINFPELLPTHRSENRYEWHIPGNIVGSEGHLRWQIVATDTAQNQATKSGAITLRDTTPPKIEHTPIQRAELGVPLPMSVKVSDNVAVAEVTLSYRTGQPGETDWKVIPSTLPSFQSSISITIPESRLKASPFHYFLKATDTAGNTQRLPKDGVFSIQLADKTPPQIHHVSVTKSAVDFRARSPLPIEAVVIDNHKVARVELSHRPIGEPPLTGGELTQRKFTKLSMTGKLQTYVATIPADSLTARGVEYFLEATDANGNSARLPTGTGTYQLRPDRVRIHSLSLSVAGSPPSQSSETNPIQISVASETRFQLRTVDVAGNVVPAIPVWCATNGIGETDPDGQFFAGIHAGRIGQVIATVPAVDESARVSLSNAWLLPRQVDVSGQKSDKKTLGDKLRAYDAVAWVQLVPAPADHLTITPNSEESPLRLAAGTGQPFRAYAYDALGNHRSADVVTWRVEGGIGEMLGETFYAGRIGRGRVVVKSGHLQAEVEIEVSFGSPRRDRN